MMRAVNTSVRLFAEAFHPTGPVIELGSYYLPGWQYLSDLRPYFSGLEYIGCDIRQGLGVDRIEDAESLTFPDGHAGAVLMLDMLAHTPHPQRAVDEARRILAPDGLLAISVPFSYRISAFPDDYWRFTASGLQVLFEGFEDTCVFSLGPRVKPRIAFGVAARAASKDFSDRKEHFQRLVEESFRRGRLRAHLNTMAGAGRDLAGTLFGRADLGVSFFDPKMGGGYRSEPVDRR